jgi:hypothetical protein
MSKERELLQKVLTKLNSYYYEGNVTIKNEIIELLAQPEQEQEVYSKGYAEAMRQQVYEAFEAGRKSALSKDWDKERDAMSEAWCLPESKQEPVAWMYDHQIEVGYDKYTEVNIIETCARNLESNNCINIRPLYLAPPKQEPLSVERIADLWTDINTNSVRNFARAIEKEHGIGGGE